MTSKDKFFSNKLLDWYKKNQRELPWRKNIRHKDYPYRVLVSEFMLQQTTVATVIPYFEKFINKWPTLKKLSHAKIEDGFTILARSRLLFKSKKFITNCKNYKFRLQRKNSKR
jgi:A/G-specific DNA glycosylase